MGDATWGRWCDQHHAWECEAQRKGNGWKDQPGPGPGPCHGRVIPGSKPGRCAMHIRKTTHAKAHVRAELAHWTVGDAKDDPAETLLRLITQSRVRAEFYATLLGEAYEAAERIAAAETTGDTTLTEDARRDLDVVLQTGGVAALIGKTYSAAGKDGHIFASGEAVRGLAKLEADERDRCANFCRLAISAGIAERQVRVAERLADTLQEVLLGALDDADLTADQRRAVIAGAGRRLRLVAAAS